MPEPKHKPPVSDSKAAESDDASPKNVSQHELVTALASAVPWTGENEGGRQVVERWLDENKPPEAKSDEAES